MYRKYRRLERTAILRDPLRNNETITTNPRARLVFANTAYDWNSIVR